MDTHLYGKEIHLRGKSWQDGVAKDGVRMKLDLDLNCDSCKVVNSCHQLFITLILLHNKNPPQKSVASHNNHVLIPTILWDTGVVLVTWTRLSLPSLSLLLVCGQLVCGLGLAGGKGLQWQ